jgi:hypothetical protein
MSWLYSQALVVEYLGENFSDGEQSAPLSGSHTQQAYCAPDKMTGFSKLSRFGMTYRPLTAIRGEELLMLYLEAFHVKTSAQQEKAQELMENAAECGVTWRESLAKYDPDTSTWRTVHSSHLEGSIEFLGTWPKWGLMRDGVLYQQPPLVHHTRETGSGSSEKLPTPQATDHRSKPTSASWKAKGGVNYSLANPEIQKKWPTPTANMHKGSSPAVIRKDGKDRSWDSLHYAVEQVTDTGGKLNPTWVEWLMGWPLGWTDLNPLATDKCHSVRQPLGES